MDEGELANAREGGGACVYGCARGHLCGFAQERGQRAQASAFSVRAFARVCARVRKVGQEAR